MILHPLKPRLARAARVAVELCSLPNKFWPKAASGIANVSSAAIAQELWTPSLPAMDLMAKSIAKLATERNGDLMVTDSLAALASCKPMA